VATAAASVAVKTPAKMPPKMITGVISGITLSLIETSTSCIEGFAAVVPGSVPREDWK
jgi:hypothetical protein